MAAATKAVTGGSEGYATVTHKIQGYINGQAALPHAARGAAVGSRDWREVTCKRCLAKLPKNAVDQWVDARVAHAADNPAVEAWHRMYCEEC